MNFLKISIALVSIAALGVTGWYLFGKSKTIILSETGKTGTKSFFDFKLKDIDGKERSFSEFKGKVVVIVNVASKCGNTPQYEDLESLYKTYNSKGVVVLGMPANNFAGQEPGSDSEIKTFCSTKYGVTFPMFSKISVKGQDQHPLYKWLTSKTENGKSDAEVTWNFQKFVIGKNGEWLASISPRTSVTDKEFLALIDKSLK